MLDVAAGGFLPKHAGEREPALGVEGLVAHEVDDAGAFLLAGDAGATEAGVDEAALDALGAGAVPRAGLGIVRPAFEFEDQAFVAIHAAAAIEALGLAGAPVVFIATLGRDRPRAVALGIGPLAIDDGVPGGGDGIPLDKPILRAGGIGHAVARGAAVGNRIELRAGDEVGVAKLRQRGAEGLIHPAIGAHKPLLFGAAAEAVEHLVIGPHRIHAPVVKEDARLGVGALHLKRHVARRAIAHVDDIGPQRAVHLRGHGARLRDARAGEELGDDGGEGRLIPIEGGKGNEHPLAPVAADAKGHRLVKRDGHEFIEPHAIELVAFEVFDVLLVVEKHAHAAIGQNELRAGESVLPLVFHIGLGGGRAEVAPLGREGVVDARLLLVDRRLFRRLEDGPHLLAGAQIIDDDLGRIAGLAEAIGPEDEKFIVLIEDLLGAVVERGIVAVAQRIVQLQLDLGLALGVEF